MSEKAFFFDRDGVLNKAIIKNGKPYPPTSLAELEVVEGSIETLQKLKEKEFKIFVITNQPDVSRGRSEKKKIEEMNKYLQDIMPIDHVYTCYHDDHHQCNCRKPKPGMIIDASRQHNIDLSLSFVVGDRWKDIEAGNSAGCKCFYLDFDYNEKKAKDYYKKINYITEIVRNI
jgi:D-glycero-D-manno-heptose 1,7-bisphosphate phosphatase